MKYLKLYENFNNDEEVDTRELLEEILSMSYILEEEGIIIQYYVRQNLNETVNSYLMGTSDDIKEKIDELDEWDDFPTKIYSYDITFNTKNIDIINEYFNKLKQNLESFDVKVEKVTNYKYRPELRPYNPLIKVFVEKTADDYGKGGALEPDNDDDINESLDDDKILSTYGLYPEDMYDIFYDFTDYKTFKYPAELDIDFNNTWTKVGGSKLKPKIEKQPRIYVYLKFDENNLDIKNKNINIVDIIKQSDVFKIVKNRLNEHNLEIISVNIDHNMEIRYRFVRIIIKKV